MMTFKFLILFVGCCFWADLGDFFGASGNSLISIMVVTGSECTAECRGELSCIYLPFMMQKTTLGGIFLLANGCHILLAIPDGRFLEGWRDSGGRKLIELNLFSIWYLRQNGSWEWKGPFHLGMNLNQHCLMEKIEIQQLRSQDGIGDFQKAIFMDLSAFGDLNFANMLAHGLMLLLCGIMNNLPVHSFLEGWWDTCGEMLIAMCLLFNWFFRQSVGWDWIGHFFYNRENLNHHGLFQNFEENQHRFQDRFLDFQKPVSMGLFSFWWSDILACMLAHGLFLALSLCDCVIVFSFSIRVVFVALLFWQVVVV